MIKQRNQNSFCIKQQLFTYKSALLLRINVMSVYSALNQTAVSVLLRIRMSYLFFYQGSVCKICIYVCVCENCYFLKCATMKVNIYFAV